MGRGQLRYGIIMENFTLVSVHPMVCLLYTSTPEIVYGFGPSFRYKKFDFSFFFQGAARVSIMMIGIHPFGAEGTRNVLQFIADDLSLILILSFLSGDTEE